MTKTPVEAGIVRAKNARQKRKVDKMAPKVYENTKSTIFIKGGNVSDILTNVFKDLHVLKVIDLKSGQGQGSRLIRLKFSQILTLNFDLEFELTLKSGAI